MTYEDFMTHIENYYGKYREGTKAGSYVLRYLRKDIQEKNLQKLIDIVMYYCRLSDYAPGISDIEYAIKRGAEDGKSDVFHKPKNTGEAEKIKKHQQEIMKLPEDERVEFANPGDLMKMINDEYIKNKAVVSTE